MAGNSFKKNFSYNFIGNLIYSLAQFLFAVIISHLVAGKDESYDSGLFLNAIAVTLPIYMGALLGMRSFQASDIKKQFTTGEYIGSRVITASLIVLISTGIAVFGGLIHANGYSADAIAMIVIFALIRCVEAFQDVFYGIEQKEERLDYVGTSFLLKGTITFISFTVFLFFTKNILLSTASMFVLTAVVLIFYDIPKASNFGSLKPEYHFDRIFQLIKICAPLGVISLLSSLISNIPRYQVQNSMGTDMLGNYARLAQLAAAGNIFMVSVGQPICKQSAVYFNKKDIKQYEKTILNLALFACIIGAIGICGAALLGHPILNFLFKSKVASYTNVFMIIVIGTVVQFFPALMYYIATAARYIWSQTFITVAAVAASFIFSAVLVPRFRLTGAAWAFLASTAVQFIGYFILIAVTVSKLKRENGSANALPVK